MSSSEAPVTEVAQTEPTTTETPAVAPEIAVLSKDPQVVEENLAKAEPVPIPGEATQEDPAAAATEDTAAAPTEETAAAPQTTEHKEGSSLLNFLKKHIPNPKEVSKKSGKAPETTEGEPAETATEATAGEPAEETPFEGGDVEFKTHGGIFGGGWKKRTLIFGKEEGYSKEALALFFAAHKVASYVGTVDKSTAAWENAAHAEITGVGLLFIVKSKALDVPLSIINLADIDTVNASYSHFTIKTHKSGEYVFQVSTPNKAKQWKEEIEKRSEQAKLVVPAIHEREEYKTALAAYTEAKGKSEAVTSDEEGDEVKKSNWTRRISGSFQRVMRGPEAKKDAVVKEATTAEHVTTGEAAPVPEVAVAEATPAETAAPATETTSPEKKDKRRSGLGFATGLFRGKQSKEPSPEPAEAPTTTEEPAPAETAETVPAPTTEATTEATASEEPAATTETTPATEKKRQSFFSGLLPKREKSATSPVVTTNGESAPEATSTEPAATTSTEPATTEAEATAPATEETTPATTPKSKGSLTRRLSSQIRSFGRSKSPDKAKPAKVSDEAPKITTPIESTAETTEAPAAATTEESAPAATTEEPVTSTEVPATTVTATDIPAEGTSTPVVSTQA